MNALDILKTHGIHPTSQRIAILDCIINSKNHLTVDQLFDKLADNKSITISMPTIYNTLNLLVNENIVSELALSTDNKKHYDYIHDEHYHVVCRKCNKIVDVSYPTFKDDLTNLLQGAINMGFVVKNETISLYGICKECQKKMNK